MNIAYLVKKNAARNTLSRNYFIFSAIVLILVIGLCSWFAHSIYSNQINKRNFQLISGSNRVENTVSETFRQMEYLIRFIGRQVVDYDMNDLAYISRILQYFGTDNHVRSTGSRTGFDWITSEGKLSVTGTNGILKKPIDITESRTYFYKSIENPLSLNFDNPSYGKVSAEWIIPSAMGFYDDDGRYAGAISLGFSIAELNNKLKEILTKEGMYFILINEENKVVVNSGEMNHEQESKVISAFIDNKKHLSKFWLEAPIVVDNVAYSYLKTMTQFPFTVIIGYDINNERYTIWDKLIPLIIAFCSIGLIFLVILHIFARSIIKPIVILSSIADKISRGEDISRFPRHIPYELYNLSVQLSKIHRYIGRIKRFKRENEQAETAKRIAQQSDQAKSELMALVSHELRTPLNAIINFSEIQKDEIFGPINNEKYLEYARDIHSSGKHLLQLINNILDLSKAEANKLDLQETNVDVKESIQSCIKTLRERAIREKIDIIEIYDDNLPTLYADELCIKQIMLNILSNAINFTDEGGKITVSAYIADKGYIIRITDTGVGIPEENLESVLEKFNQAYNTNRSRRGGTGLGLPLTKTLVELHKGDLKLESELGVGTTITIIFPKDRVNI